jgi:hypothetical protein
MTPTPGRRVAVIVLLFAVMIAALVIDRSEDRGTTRVRALPGAAGPEATGTDALSSSWYCPGGTANGGPADVTVNVLNPTDRAVHGTLTVVRSQGDPTRHPMDVGASSSVDFVLSTLAPQAPWAAAVVDLDGGGAVVEQLVVGPLGIGTEPCAVAASRTWYFATGSTAKDTTQSLALFNPFPDGAIVDLAFATGEGRRVPGDFQGIVVPAGSVTVVDVGAHLRRQDVVSTEVRARAGRIVAGQVVVRTAGGGVGVSSTLGAPALGDTWYFPDGLVTDGVVERYELYNPSGREASVDLEVTLDEGEAEPFELTVPAQGRLSLNVKDESRIPKSVAHAAVARSVNGVPVVVERVVESSAPRVGRVETMGGRRLARRWGIPVGAANDRYDEWVVVHNPGAAPATISVIGLADGQRVPIDGLQRIVVPAGKRMAYRLGDHIKRDSLPVVVESTRPVAVERALYVNGAPGIASSLAIPLA